jgi:hypothetical protein
MKTTIRTACLVAIVLGLATMAAIAAGEPVRHPTSLDWHCCENGSDCQGAKLCCNPELVGALPCAPTAPGYCRDSCYH